MDLLQKKKQQLEAIRAAREAKQRLVDHYVVSRPSPTKRVKDVPMTSTEGASSAHVTSAPASILSKSDVRPSSSFSPLREGGAVTDVPMSEVALRDGPVKTSASPPAAAPGSAPAARILSLSSASSSSALPTRRRRQSSILSPTRPVAVRQPEPTLVCPPRHDVWNVWSLYDGAQHRCQFREGSFYCCSATLSSQQKGHGLHTHCTLLPRVILNREVRSIVSVAATELVYHGYRYCRIRNSISSTAAAHMTGAYQRPAAAQDVSLSLPSRRTSTEVVDTGVTDNNDNSTNATSSNNNNRKNNDNNKARAAWTVSTPLTMRVPCVVAVYEPPPVRCAARTANAARHDAAVGATDATGRRTPTHSHDNHHHRLDMDYSSAMTASALSGKEEGAQHKPRRPDDLSAALHSANKADDAMSSNSRINHNNCSSSSSSEADWLPGWELTGEEAVRSRLFGCACGGRRAADGAASSLSTLRLSSTQPRVPLTTEADAPLFAHLPRPWRRANGEEEEDDETAGKLARQEAHAMHDHAMTSQPSPGLLLAWTAIPITRGHVRSGGAAHAPATMTLPAERREGGGVPNRGAGASNRRRCQRG